MSTSATPPGADDGGAEERHEAAALPAAYVIPRELAQATLNYLAAQPYREVFPLVQALEALEPLPDP